MRKKVTFVGAGMTGSTMAQLMAQRGHADVVLVDIVDGLAAGKALDIQEASPWAGSSIRIQGTTDWAVSSGSDVVVVTSGVPRKPGMTREDLLGTNAGIVRSVVAAAIEHSPDAVFIIFANPMDAMCHVALAASGLPAARVVGQGGMLDSALFNGTAKLLERYGVATHAAQKLKPWAVFTTLSLPPAQPAVPLDMFLMASAQRLNKPVFGLESIEEQIAVLDALSDSDQVELLRQTVCHYDEFQVDVDTMIEHYLARDLGAIMQMALRYRSPSQDRFLDLLLWQRNRRMAARILPHLQEGGAFIAIGVLHLPGLGGVLDILSSHGYTIESVY